MVRKPVFVIPYLYDLHIAEEDGMGLDRRLASEITKFSPDSEKEESDKEPGQQSKPIVVVVAYPHVSMTKDVLPLEADPRFELQWRCATIPQPFPHTQAVILPGSRQTRSDLEWLLKLPWKAFLKAHVQAGGRVLGLCGGYQMLGREISDEDGIESGKPGSTLGLNLLPVTTIIESTELKVVRPQVAMLLTGKGVPDIKIEGFEVHCGRTIIDSDAPTLQTLVRFEDGQDDGLTNGRVHGSYLHGMLHSRQARDYLLLGQVVDLKKNDDIQEDPIDRLASHLETCGLDFQTISSMLHSATDT